MFEKNMRVSYLLDVYGSILDDRSRSVMQAYYEDDLSLSEIADGEGISRQGVRHIIKKSEEQLDFLDSSLHLSEHYTKLENFFAELLQISSSLSKSSDENVQKSAERINFLLHSFGSN